MSKYPEPVDKMILRQNSRNGDEMRIDHVEIAWQDIKLDEKLKRDWEAIQASKQNGSYKRRRFTQN